MTWPQGVMVAWLAYSFYSGAKHIVETTKRDSSAFTAGSILVWLSVILGLVATLSAGGFW